MFNQTPPLTANNSEALSFVSPVMDTILTLERVIIISSKSASTVMTLTVSALNQLTFVCFVSCVPNHTVYIYYCHAAAHSCSPLLFSEDEAKLGARRLARVLQKLGFKVRIIAQLLVNNTIAGTRFL